MKTRFSILASLMLLMTISFAFTFSTPEDKYFEGKWSVLVKDTPQGSATIPMRFETVDGKTTGYYYEEGTAEEKKMNSAVINGDVLSTAFFMAGYNLTLTLTKIDEDHANGDLLGIFDAEGTRVKKD
jgi:cytochrome c